MQNEFVLVGPKGDPASIRGLSDAVDALKRISARSQTFVSRADDSGTHRRELKLWRAMGIDPIGKPWYQEAGMGMRETLNLGNKLQGYVLVDRGTWLAMRARLDLVLLSYGDRRLVNPYSVIAVSQNPHREVNAKAGKVFVDWMTSDAVQALIGAVRVDGEPLFTPAEGVP